jgi:hypothetical protein
MAFVAIAAAIDAAGRWKGAVTAASVGVIAVLTARAALGAVVPNVHGIDQVVRYLRANGPTDSVLYSGTFDGVFGFYMRALDPKFEGRLVLSNRLLYEYRQAISFEWVETPFVVSASDVVALIRRKCGCKWVAVEIGRSSPPAASDSLLRKAMESAEFERVRSFQVAAHPVTQIDLYRFTPPLEPAPPMDLVFPSFSTRVFEGVRAIPSRP